MPGYTHLQRAQPVLFAHHLLAYHDMLERDGERFADCRRRADVLPLGAGALAGTTFPIDPVARRARAALRAGRDQQPRRRLRPRLRRRVPGGGGDHRWRTSRASPRSWCSGRRRSSASSRLPDDFATGSSIMPQKKNPDVAELVRGKTGRVYGDLVALLTDHEGRCRSRTTAICRRTSRRSSTPSTPCKARSRC